MRVLFLGTQKQYQHPTVSAFLRGGPARGVEVQLVDKAQFFETDLSRFDIVCLKNHYTDPRVWERLEAQPHLRAVNRHEPTALAMDRRAVDDLLRDAGIPTPPNARTIAEFRALHFPVFQKPLRADLHDLSVIPALDRAPVPDFTRFFYQEKVPMDGLDYKLYCVGETTIMVVRPESRYKDPAEKVHERREVREPIPALAAHARRVGKVTGLEIYGVDFVGQGGTYYVIDVNPFPGFIGIPRAADLWWALLRA